MTTTLYGLHYKRNNAPVHLATWTDVGVFRSICHRVLAQMAEDDNGHAAGWEMLANRYRCKPSPALLVYPQDLPECIKHRGLCSTCQGVAVKLSGELRHLVHVGNWA